MLVTKEQPKQASPLNSPHFARRLLLAAALLTVAGVSAFILARNLIDFPVYYAAGQSLLNGRTDLYAPDFARGQTMDYRYPPFFLIALAPLWLAPYKAAAFLWCVFGVLEAALCAVFVRRSEWRKGESQGNERNASINDIGAWVLIVFATGQYYVMILHYGNAHLLAITLMFGSLYLFIRRRDSAAAALMSLAITIKLTPILLLPYFAVKRRWKFLLLTIAVTGAINAAPAAYFGVSVNALLLRTWRQHVITDQEYHETNGPINLSLKGQLRRYLTHVDYDQRVDGDTRYSQVNFARMPSSRSDALWLIASSALAVASLGLIWSTSRRRGERFIDDHDGEAPSIKNGPDEVDSNQEALEIGLMICLMVLIGPLTSKIYFIALLWPVACLAFHPNRKDAAAFVRNGLWVIAAAGLLAPLLPGRPAQRLLLVVGADFYLNCLVLLLTVYTLIRSHRRLAARSAEPRTQSR